jgi:hypothetical protein
MPSRYCAPLRSPVGIHSSTFMIIQWGYSMVGDPGAFCHSTAQRRARQTGVAVFSACCCGYRSVDLL